MSAKAGGERVYQFRDILHWPFDFEADNLELNLALVQWLLIILRMLNELENCN